ncbi:MAG: chromate efflux transporter [Pseudomonadota bacterium]
MNDLELLELRNPPSLRDLAQVFLKLGATSFGGPAVHIAMMEEDLVRRRSWISKEDFLDLLGATQLIPGPNSTEMAIHIGYKTAGWRGLLVAGVCFILPAFLIVWLLAFLYVQLGDVPKFHDVFLGIKPVVLAVVVQAMSSLSRTALKDRLLWILGGLSLALYLVFKQEVPILLLAGFLNLCLRRKESLPGKKRGVLSLVGLALLFYLAPWFLPESSVAPAIPTSSAILGYFSKVGSMLFGSGYVLLSFLQNDLVDKFHWLSQQQLFDAVAVGQFTPGPVFTTATFIGFLLAGHKGAALATIGIFLPAFVFVALSAPYLSKLRGSKVASLVLDGINVASLSLMLGVILSMASGTMVSYSAGLLFLVSLFALIRYKVNSFWLVLAGAFLGFFGVL